MKVAVIGSSGGMGRFFAKYFASRGHEVTGADPAKSSMRDTRFKAVGSNREAVEGAEVVVLATPIEKTVEAAEEVIPQMRHGTCLVELTSIKGKILGPLRRAAAAGGVELLSVHPLFGPSLSSFKGMKICVIETDGKASETRAAVLFPDAVIIPMKEREHDRMMGLMLSLTHIMNIAYAGVVDRYLTPQEFRRLETPTASVQLSLAEGVLSQDPGLYSYIQLENEFSLEFADALIDELTTLRRIVGGRKKKGEDRAAFEALYSGLARRYVGDSKTSLRGVYGAFEKGGRHRRRHS